MRFTDANGTFLKDANGNDLHAEYKITIAAAAPDNAGGAAGPATAQQTPQGKTQNPQNTTGQSSVQVVDCSSVTAASPCTFSHSFLSLDKEYWDVSVGVTTPGVKVPTFNSSTPTANPTITRSVQLYGILDISPFASRWGADSYAPRLNVGLPLSSQPFYMPYFGASENLTGRIPGFPLQLNVFAGVIYLKETFNLTPPGGVGVFRKGRELKGVFGVEIPVSSIASKITSAVKGQGGGTPSGGKTPGQ
jgi:hypothetical protein